MKRNVLLIDDNTIFIDDFKAYTRDIFQVLSATSAGDGLTLMRMHDPDVVLLDLLLKGSENGLEVLQKILHMDPDMPVIMVTDFPDHKTAVEAMQLGAVHYTSKAPNMETLKAVIEQQVQMLPWRRLYREQQDQKFGEFIGESETMQKVRAKIDRAALTDMPVLITGDSGTGKELVANAIHRKSQRASRAMHTVNCSTLSANLFESEFFGHERGAFTNAYKFQRGKFEMADHSTLFLDEIGELPLESQPKILEAIEYKRYWRLGGEQVMHSDVRLIAATNRDLEELIEEGSFRKDLYYRLKVIEIHVPSLTERREDIPSLARHFLELACREIRCPIPSIPPAVMTYWQNKPWPGNVRQLRHKMEEIALESFGGTVSFEQLDHKQDLAPTPGYQDVFNLPYAEAKRILVENFTRDYILRALRKNNNNVVKTANEIGVNRTTIYRILKNLSQGDQAKK
ncbi:MAG: sigma-54-dependent Fis family transcriptional regulator [Deferribacteres bacterium]|nr:sigma-54-dependent Fis family transcriptional regulator [candidate division KSB1 bacterium]MCB9508790.1 sigma-54-dependent Fis family transcriptional regulator [Deferribacteres bacterium]